VVFVSIGADGNPNPHGEEDFRLPISFTCLEFLVLSIK
jgi:hypothetical protein